MAESVLEEILEQVVQTVAENNSKAEISIIKDVALKYTETIEKNKQTTGCEELKEVVREDIKDSNEMECVHVETDKEVDNESEPSDEMFTDENNNDMLTTEDEAEDFLQHVLRDTNDSDEDAEKKSQGFEVTAESCEKIGGTLSESERSLNIDSALANLVDSHIITKSQKMLEETNRNEFDLDINNCIMLPAVQESDSSSISDISVNSADKVLNVNVLGSSDLPVQQNKSAADGNGKSSEPNLNNNNTDISNSSNIFDDTNILKYDWSKCYNPCVTDNRNLSTPDAEMERISPELSCMIQLSPTQTYGKDHMIGCQRLYSRQQPQTVRAGSPLNTPDPLFYEDTDSNESCLGLFRKYNASLMENPIPTLAEVDVNNNSETNVATKGIKRKHIEVNNQDEVGPCPNILPDSVVTSIMNQGRPPDISTWRAVTSSCDTQGNFTNDDISGQRNKPTCTVPPFQNIGSYSSTLLNGLNGFGTSEQQAMNTGTIYNPYESSNNFSMSQQSYNHYNSALLRSSCQFTTNQARNASPYGPQIVNNGFQNSAAYRLDFSSPVNVGSPGVLNFVSHPPYLGVDITRPRAVYATSFQNAGYSSGFRYSVMPNRPLLNMGEIRNCHQPCSQIFQQMPFRNPYMNLLNQTTGGARPPSATQSFYDSEFNNSPGSTMDGVVKVTEQTEEVNKDNMSGPRDSNNNETLIIDESSGGITEEENSILGCEECDLVTETSVDLERNEAVKSNEKTRNTLDKMNVRTDVDEPVDTGTLPTINNATSCMGNTLNKAVQSNEADSTTIDLTSDSTEVDNDLSFKDKSEGPGSPTPAHAYQKVQNKYFTEFYMKKSRTNSPITSFCTALDLSKREEKKDLKKATLTTVPQNIMPYGEPNIPIPALLNSEHAPTLAYSGAMLVPYMNSIFAAMANLNKTQAAPKDSLVDTSINPTVNANVTQTLQNTRSDSPLTQTNNLTLNQQVLMYSNILQTRQAAASTPVTLETSGYSTSAVKDGTVNAPTVNLNSIPLPLYAAPLQYPIRPLVPVVNPVCNAQGFVSPCMYRFNLGVPIQTSTCTNTPFSTASVADGNNNAVSGTVSSTVSDSSTCASTTTNYQTAANDETTASHNIAKTALQNPKKTTGRRGRPGRKSLADRKRMAADLKKSISMQERFNKSSAPPVRKSISAVEGLNMSIQGSNISSATRTQSGGLVMYQPIPQARMYQPVVDQRRRVFKAKHFPITKLQIGTYKYTPGPSCSDRTARVKFLFSKKSMVYEFQLESPDGSPGVCKDMVEISIPFLSIISLWLYDRDMRVEVKNAPSICLGKKGLENKFKICNAPVYNRKLRMDITEGQLSSVPYHYIQFKNSCADRVRTELREFDSRFEVMFRLPLVEDSAKSLNSTNGQPSSHLLDPSMYLPTGDVNNNDPVFHREENVEVSMIGSCSCTGGCTAQTCQCCVKGTTCTEGMCDCVNCRNPLNILHQLGLPAESARTDPCLMENIYQIKRLDCYVKTQLVLECCHIPVLLFSCIPGEVKCVNVNCNARYKYSWCTAKLLNEDTTPRNHCIKCGRCTDYRNIHCQRCGICYFAGERRTFKCPVCRKKSKEALENNSSTDSEDDPGYGLN